MSIDLGCHSHKHKIDRFLFFHLNWINAINSSEKTIRVVINMFEIMLLHFFKWLKISRWHSLDQKLVIVAKKHKTTWLASTLTSFINIFSISFYLWIQTFLQNFSPKILLFRICININTIYVPQIFKNFWCILSISSLLINYFMATTGFDIFNIEIINLILIKHFFDFHFNYFV